MNACSTTMAALWPSQHMAACCCQEAVAPRQPRHAPQFSKPSVAPHHSCSTSSSHSKAHQRGWRSSCGPTGPLLPLLLLLLLSLLQVPAYAAARLLRGDKSVSASDRKNAQQQTCMECRSCRTPGCMRACSPSCGATPYAGISSWSGGGGGAAGGGLGNDATACKQLGLDMADNVAAQVCKSVQSMCGLGVNKAQAAVPGLVSGSQCAIQAYGACSKAALMSNQTPCGANLYFGFRACSGRQFADLYRQYVLSGCSDATSRN